MSVFIWIVACAPLVLAAPGDNGGGYQDSLQNVEYGPPQGSGYGPPPEPNYEFQYEVFGDNNFYGHQESRKGSKTQGKYHVLLPDGRKQIVTYWADETGYHPTITYEPPNASSGSGGYAYGDSSQASAPQQRYNNGRSKRQELSIVAAADEGSDERVFQHVHVYDPERTAPSAPVRYVRNRVRRFTAPKKTYLVVYPHLSSLRRQ